MKLDIEITEEQRCILYSHAMYELRMAVQNLDEANKFVLEHCGKPVPERVKSHINEKENRVSLWIEIISKLEERHEHL